MTSMSTNPFTDTFIFKDNASLYSHNNTSKYSDTMRVCPLLPSDSNTYIQTRNLKHRRNQNTLHLAVMSILDFNAAITAMPSNKHQMPGREVLYATTYSLCSG